MTAEAGDRAATLSWTAAEPNGSPVTGYPISYAVNGKQYVAVSTGSSLVSSGVNRLAPELKPGTGNSIFTLS